MQYYLLIDNAVTGPFAALTVREMLGAGLLPEGTCCAVAGSQVWHPADGGAWEVSTPPALPRMDSYPAQVWHQPVATVQQTGKQWKGLLLVAVLITLAGLLGLLVIPGNAKALAVLLVMGGLGLIAAAKLGAWWNHG